MHRRRLPRIKHIYTRFVFNSYLQLKTVYHIKHEWKDELYNRYIVPAGRGFFSCCYVFYKYSIPTGSGKKTNGFGIFCTDTNREPRFRDLHDGQDYFERIWGVKIWVASHESPAMNHEPWLKDFHDGEDLGEDTRYELPVTSYQLPVTNHESPVTNHDFVP